MSTSGATTERRVALAVQARVRAGAYADRAFAGEARRANLVGRPRAQAHRLAFGSVQRRRTLDWVIDAAVSAPDALEPAVRDVLRLVAFELGWSDATPAPIAIDQAVRLAGDLAGDAKRRRARRGLVNAVSRAIHRDLAERLAALRDDTWQGAALAHSVPDWIARTLFAELGAADASGVLRRANEAPESIVRWNGLAGRRDDLERQLPEGAERCAPPFDDAYRIPGAFALEDSGIWADGLAMAQSRASMLPVLALDPKPGERVLDLCAAPGAKSTLIADRVGSDGTVVAVEAHPGRAEALRRLARRMGADIQVVDGDARTVPLDGRFDAVLVDPPCSGLGVLAARPDARWRRDESDVAAMGELQRDLLSRALRLVVPGGRVVYSTCTLLAHENEDVVADADADVDDLGSEFGPFAHPAFAGTLLTLPHRDGTDGFFVARLRPRGSR